MFFWLLLVDMNKSNLARKCRKANLRLWLRAQLGYGLFWLKCRNPNLRLWLRAQLEYGLFWLTRLSRLNRLPPPRRRRAVRRCRWHRYSILGLCCVLFSGQLSCSSVISHHASFFLGFRTGLLPNARSRAIGKRDPPDGSNRSRVPRLLLLPFKVNYIRVQYDTGTAMNCSRCVTRGIANVDGDHMFRAVLLEDGEAALECAAFARIIFGPFALECLCLGATASDRSINAAVKCIGAPGP